MRPNDFLPNTGFWKNKRVLVTGGSGFLGRHIVERLKDYGATLITPRRTETNLSDFGATLKCFLENRPDLVFHSAAYYGGLGITLKEPGTIYFNNMLMSTNVMEAARLTQVKKFIAVGTACSYPGHLTGAMKESDFWSGPLHDSVTAYGGVKKMMHIQAMAYKKQYGFNAIHLLPTNLYGPYDAFDAYRSHVVGALVAKFCEAHARNEDVMVWGTGAPIREFLYVDDCADGIVLAAERYNDVSPLNIGTGVGTTIRQLVEDLCHTLNFKNKVIWDASKPDGQMAKTLDIAKMKATLDWVPRTGLRDGLKKTIAWYQENLLQASTLRQAA
ncbi:MAG: NAD-dependent epimerase/dehydratase family protein [Deltaproteobacteria bacterium]|nr:NAD-dependent epimerase/dehydratase family protein [Deltaproteobacteria bacterium]